MMQIVYISCTKSQQIYVWLLKTNGLLTLLQILNIGANIQPLAIHPNKKFLYAGIKNQPYGIICFYINEYGLLRKISLISIFGSPTYLTIDSKGKNIFCALYHDNSIIVIPIDQYGKFLSSIKILKGLIKCHSVNINNIHNRLWVPCLGEDVIRIFDINTEGKITPYYKMPLIKMSQNSGPRHMVFNYVKRCVYVINELTSTVSVISANNNCYFKEIQTIDMMPNIYHDKRWAADIQITPNFRWLFCSDRFLNIVSFFNIFDSGRLKLLGHEFTEEHPKSFFIDHTGCYLILAGQQSNFVVVYKINSLNGSLRMISKYHVGTEPSWVIILKR